MKTWFVSTGCNRYVINLLSSRHTPFIRFQHVAVCLNTLQSALMCSTLIAIMHRMPKTSHTWMEKYSISYDPFFRNVFLPSFSLVFAFQNIIPCQLSPPPVSKQTFSTKYSFNILKVHQIPIYIPFHVHLPITYHSKTSHNVFPVSTRLFQSHLNHFFNSVVESYIKGFIF